MTTFLQCPVCAQFPIWSLAPRTSEKRGVKCAFVVGCSHTAALFGTTVIEAPQVGETVARWNTEAERLFATTTAHWTPEQRSARRRALSYPASAPSELSAVNSESGAGAKESGARSQEPAPS